MKKSLVVLLIAVLALSAVFAADVAITVEGDVSASYVFDFDDMTGTYNVPELNGALAWELVLPVAKAGSEYPYIDVAGEIEVDLADVAYYLTPEVDFSTFAIVGEDWKVDFLASIGTLDYAVSAIDTTKYVPRNAYGSQTGRKVKSALTYIWEPMALYSNAVAISKDGVGTLTFVGTKTSNDTGVEGKSYEVVAVFKHWTEAQNHAAKLTANRSNAEIVLGVEYSAPYDGKDIVSGLYPVIKATPNYDSTTFAVEGESEELKLSDNISTQFGFGFAKVELGHADTMNAGFSTKTSYEDIYTVAADFGYDFSETSLYPEENRFSFDIATSFKYEMVSVDVYYADGVLSYYNDKDLYKTSNYQYYTYEKIEEDVRVRRATNLLSAKASVEVAEIGTTFTFTGADLLGDKNLSYKAVNTYFDNYTFTFDASTKLTKTVSVGFKAEADYSEEVGVTAYAGVTANPLNKTTDYAPQVVFNTGIAYAKDGFTFSVDFCSDACADASYLITADDAKCYKSAIDASVITSDVTVWEYAFANKKYAFTVKAGYEAETFKLSSAVEYNTHETSAYKQYDWSLDRGLYVTAGIESDKLVDGATLSLTYESGELLGYNLKVADDGEKTDYVYFDPSYGSVTAAVTVEF